jgi:hypothetical protein
VAFGAFEAISPMMLGGLRDLIRLELNPEANTTEPQPLSISTLSCCVYIPYPPSLACRGTSCYNTSKQAACCGSSGEAPWEVRRQKTKRTLRLLPLPSRHLFPVVTCCSLSIAFPFLPPALSLCLSLPIRSIFCSNQLSYSSNIHRLSPTLCRVCSATNTPKS